MKIDGRCHCGFIAYRAQVDPESAAICHCTDCQTLSGTAFRTIVMAPDESVEMLGGAPKVYIKTGESGRAREQTFCPECGTPIYSAAPGPGPRLLSFRLGTVLQRDELAPRRQIWCRSAQAWLPELGSLPQNQTQ